MADHDVPTNPSCPGRGVDRRKLLQISVQACGLAAAASGGYVVLNYMSPLPEGLGDQDVAIQMLAVAVTMAGREVMSDVSTSIAMTREAPME